MVIRASKDAERIKQRPVYVKITSPPNEPRQVWEAYAGAARRRVHLATILPRSPSGHRPGRRQARHARILQIGLHLTQPRSVCTPPRHGPASWITTRKDSGPSIEENIRLQYFQRIPVLYRGCEFLREWSLSINKQRRRNWPFWKSSVSSYYILSNVLQ